VNIGYQIKEFSKSSPHQASRSKAPALECNSQEAPASRNKTFQKQELLGNGIPKRSLGTRVVNYYRIY